MSRMLLRRSAITEATVDETTPRALEDGEARIAIDRFGYSANNVTYAAAGDTLNYWKFFPVDSEHGLVPVWGYGDVVESRCEGIDTGTRLFGYFPPAAELIVQPMQNAPGHFVDGMEHRAELPAGYNLYRKVQKKDADAEARHMLLYPLFVTSWCLWDAIQAADWFGAKRVLLLSASSKTAIGLADALKRDPNAPRVTGMTSAGNVDFVTGLGLYDEVVTYDAADDLEIVDTVIVDMSGNAALMGRLHNRLGDAMRQTLDVGLTHWEAERRDPGIIRDRSKFFFAPAHIAGRIKEWGPQKFNETTQTFLTGSIADSARWMSLKTLDGLEALAEIHPAACAGTLDASEGLVVEVTQQA